MSISPSTLQLLSHVRNSNWKGQEMKIPFQKFGKYEPDSNLVHLFTCGDEKLKKHLLICICLALLTILTSVCLSLCSALHPGSFGSTWLKTGVWVNMFHSLRFWKIFTPQYDFAQITKMASQHDGICWTMSWGWLVQKLARMGHFDGTKFFQGFSSSNFYAWKIKIIYNIILVINLIFFKYDSWKYLDNWDLLITPCFSFCEVVSCYTKDSDVYHGIPHQFYSL